MPKGDSRVLVAAAMLCSLFAASAASAQTPSLGAADGYAVLGSTTVTNSGLTSVQGDVGLTPGSSITGFPPGVVSGSININNASAVAAKTAASETLTELDALPCDFVFGPAQDLSALSPLSPGVYCFTSSAIVTGPLTLVGGDSGAGFIFKIASTLTVANNSTVVINGGTECNVYWAVGSSAFVGTNASFAGSLLAQTNITFGTGATALGGVFSLNGAVTLDTNFVTARSCGQIFADSFE